MAIAFELQAHSDASIDQVFSTIADLRSWGSFAGVALVGPARPVMPGDRIDVRLKVVRKDIESACVVRTVDEPSHRQPGYVDVRSIEGPFDARMSGRATAAANGCDLSVEVHGIGRGAARFLEGPVEVIMHTWATHQLRHLLDVVARSHARAAS